MEFTLTPEQEAIRENVERLCARFDDDYWLDRDDTGEFPADFHQAMAEAGWLGIAMPEEFGGAALGVTEAAILVDAHAFQRHVENHYQLQEEWALREVSKESPSLVRLARSMGYPGGPAADVRRRFISDWEAYAHEVRRLVGRYFYGSI